MYQSPADKKFKVATESDKLTSITSTTLDTLEWYDQSGGEIGDQTGNSSSLSDKHTQNNSNKFSIKLKYQPVNYLGHKTTSRLFYRCQHHNSMNGQILINTPHNIVKIFDYSILDYKYDQTQTAYTFSSGPSSGLIQANSGQSMLEYDDENGKNVRESFALSMKRIERLVVFSDEILAKRKEEIDNETIWNGEVNNGYTDYLSTQVAKFDGVTIWKGMHMLGVEYYSDPNTNTIAYAANITRNYYGKSNEFATGINHAVFDTFAHPTSTVDVITHELLHGLGIVPSRKVMLKNESGTFYNYLPKTEIIQKVLDFRQFIYQDAAGYPSDPYNDLCLKYKEYVDEEINNGPANQFLSEADFGSGNVTFENSPDGNLTPLENAGGAGTSGAHFENFGYFASNNQPPQNGDNFFVGFWNELMIGSITSNAPYGVITGLTMNAIKVIKEDETTSVFKILRDDGELLPANHTQEDRDTIPWHPVTATTLNVQGVQLSAEERWVGQCLYFNGQDIQVQGITTGESTPTTLNMKLPDGNDATITLPSNAKIIQDTRVSLGCKCLEH